MPSASLSASNMNNLVRDSYQSEGLIRSNQRQLITASQTSLQKLPASSPQFLHNNHNSIHSHNINSDHHNQQVQHMQFPPPPPMAQLVTQAGHLQKNETFNSMIVPQSQQQQYINMAHNGLMGQQANSNSQASLLMSSMIASNKNQNPHYISQQQQQHYMQQQPQQTHPNQMQQQQQPTMSAIPYPAHLTASLPANQPPAPQQQQVPLTTIMIPATAAAQIQSASLQIQQAAQHAVAQNSGQPQILVFMIPYMISPQQKVHGPPTIPPTPEQPSLNSTLVRHSQSQSRSGSMLRSSQHRLEPPTPAQQQQQPPSATHSRASSNMQSKKQEPEKFYIKANLSYQATRNKMELSFQKGDILHVLDTLQTSDYGLVGQYWLATRVKSNGKDADKGLIPDRSKAEEIALEQRTQEMGGDGGGTIDGSSGSVLGASVGRVNFLRRRAAQRSKSLCKDNWDNVVFDIGSFKLPVYERVIFKHPGFCRPVVIFGPLADVAREKLLKDYPEKYSYPTGFHQSQDHPKVIRLKGILEVVDQGKHALLDITPSAVEKLNYVNLVPIVIFMKTDSKSIIKEFRSRAAKSLDPNARDEDTLRRDGKSSRKLLEQSMKLEKLWSHVFTATLNLSTMGSEMWYRKLRETIENQQSLNVWMGERRSDKKTSTVSNGSEMSFSMQNCTQQTALSSSANITCVDNFSLLSEKFNESLTITSKSTVDLLPDGTYGNRSQLRNAYAHSLAQKLARASSEPKLNGLLSDHDNKLGDEDDDEVDDENDDDDDCIKKPFPAEFENSSSVSSSNGAASYSQGSMSGSNMTYQHYPPPLSQVKSTDQSLSSKPADSIYSTRNNTMASSSIGDGSLYSNGNCNSSSNTNYYPLPPMKNDNGYPNQTMGNVMNHSNSSNAATTNNNSNNVIDLSRNHESRGSGFQVYSDMNQNSYHYYNLNKI